ncbi:MAG TPA: hypothetical protein VGX52_04165 [Burkholderiales bacterium]|nr:hypothetical protein [Burkholderiales bacterium]
MNPYAPPAAKVEDAAALPESEAVFFAVSGLKLAVMSIVTFGLYEIYWFYKNWKCVQRNTGDDVSAPLRAVFYPLISYPLFKRIRSHARSSGVESDFPAGVLAIAVFLVALLWRLPDPWWLVSFFGFLPLLPVQRAVNAVNRKLAPAADANTRFRGWNIFGLIAGGIVLALTVTGAFVPE